MHWNTVIAFTDHFLCTKAQAIVTFSIKLPFHNNFKNKKAYYYHLVNQKTE